MTYDMAAHLANALMGVMVENMVPQDWSVHIPSSNGTSARIGGRDVRLYDAGGDRIDGTSGGMYGWGEGEAWAAWLATGLARIASGDPIAIGNLRRYATTAVYGTTWQVRYVRPD